MVLLISKISLKRLLAKIAPVLAVAPPKYAIAPALFVTKMLGYKANELIGI